MLGNVQDADIKLLRIFRKIVECGGFLPAQSALNMSASSISSHMSQLESRMGGRLCERGHGEFRLTEHGRNVLAASDKLFAGLDEFKGHIAKSKNHLVGELRLGLMSSSVTHPDRRIPKALEIFRKRAPEATINLGIFDYYGLEPKVAKGELQVAIGLCLHRYSNLSYIPLFDERHLLYCGAAHPLFCRRDEELNFQELNRASYVSWGDGDKLFEDDWRFNEVAYSSTAEGVAHLVRSGQYISFIPTHYAKPWVEQRQFRPLLPRQMQRVAKYYLITRNDDQHQDVAQVLLQALHLEFKSHEDAF